MCISRRRGARPRSARRGRQLPPRRSSRRYNYQPPCCRPKRSEPTPESSRQTLIQSDFCLLTCNLPEKLTFSVVLSVLLAVSVTPSRGGHGCRAHWAVRMRPPASRRGGTPRPIPQNETNLRGRCTSVPLLVCVHCVLHVYIHKRILRFRGVYILICFFVVFE